jgi:hypothetical protein
MVKGGHSLYFHSIMNCSWNKEVAIQATDKHQDLQAPKTAKSRGATPAVPNLPLIQQFCIRNTFRNKKPQV